MKIILSQPFLTISFTLLIIVGLFAGAGLVIGIQSPAFTHAASEDSRYGILGQPAPDLDLNGWIDGKGRTMAPIRLRAFMGKVVVLYFFQDW